MTNIFRLLQGAFKLEEFDTDKEGAIKLFRKLYYEKTGNEFGHVPEDFVVYPGG